MTSKDQKNSADEQQSVPFAEDIQVDLFFPGAGRRRLLEEVKKAITDEVSVITLTGDEGSGKSMICHMIKKELPDTLHSVYFPNSLGSFDDIVRMIVLLLTIETTSTSVSTGELVAESIEQLKKEGKRLVAIFDEADKMYLATVERIRKMLDLANENETVLQVIFSGRKNLLENLDRLSIVQFSSNREAAFSLAPLGLSETYAYLNHATQMRMQGRNKNLFTPEAAKKIYSMAKGNIRVTNMLAAKSLEKMDSDASFMVLLENVYEDVTPMEEKRKEGMLFHLLSGGKRIYLASGVIVLAVIILVWQNLDFGDAGKKTRLTENDQPAIEAGKHTSPPVLELEENSPNEQNKLKEQEKPKKNPASAKVTPGTLEPQGELDKKNLGKERKIVLQEIDTLKDLETLKVIETTLQQRAEKDIADSVVPLDTKPPEIADDIENIEIAEKDKDAEVAPAERQQETENVEDLSVSEQEGGKILPSENERENREYVANPEDNSSAGDAEKGTIATGLVNPEVTRQDEKEEMPDTAPAETMILEIHKNGLEKIVHDVDSSHVSSEVFEGGNKLAGNSGDTLNTDDGAGTTSGATPLTIEKNNIAVVDTGREKMMTPENEVFDSIIISEIKKRYPLSQNKAETGDDSASTLLVDVAKKPTHIAPVKLITRGSKRVNAQEPAVIPDGETLYKEALETGMRWIRGENASLYTLQIMVVPTASSEKKLQEDFKTMVYRNLPDRFSILHNEKNLFLFYGSYPGVEAARQARNQLPEKLKKYEPYPLSVGEAVEKSISE